MPTPQDKIESYQKQVRFRTTWLMVSLLVGVLVGFVVHYTGSGFPPETAGIIAAGIVFFPVYFWHTNRKGYVSTREAWKLRAQVKR